MPLLCARCSSYSIKWEYFCTMFMSLHDTVPYESMGTGYSLIVSPSVVNKDLSLKAKAKAKDLTFKAKAKDSKFVLEDSSRPRTTTLLKFHFFCRQR